MSCQARDCTFHIKGLGLNSPWIKRKLSAWMCNLTGCLRWRTLLQAVFAVISSPLVPYHPVNEVTQALVCQNFAVTQPKARIYQD